MQRCDRGIVFCFLDSLREGSPYSDRAGPLSMELRGEGYWYHHYMKKIKIVIESDCMPLMWKVYQNPGDDAFMFAETRMVTPTELRKLKKGSHRIEDGWWLKNR